MGWFSGAFLGNFKTIFSINFQAKKVIKGEIFFMQANTQLSF